MIFGSLTPTVDMPSFDKSIVVPASRSTVWHYLRYQIQGSHKRFITAQDSEHLLIVRHVDEDSLIYLLNPGHNPDETLLRIVVTSDINAHQTLAYRDDLEDALIWLPGDKPGVFGAPPVIGMANAHLQRVVRHCAGLRNESHVAEPDELDMDVAKIKNEPESIFWLDSMNAERVRKHVALNLLRLQDRGCTMLVLWLVSLAASAALTSAVIQTLMLTIFDHTTTNATIIRYVEHSCGKAEGGICYTVQFEYQDSGRTFQGTATPSSTEFQTLQKQNTLLITYSLFDPGVYVPGRRGVEAGDLIMFLAMPLVMGASIAYIWRFGRLNQHYKKDGVLMYGKLLSIKTNWLGTPIKLYFEFTTPQGLVIQDSLSEGIPTHDPVSSDPAVQQGAVALYYVDDNEYQLL